MFILWHSIFPHFISKPHQPLLKGNSHPSALPTPSALLSGDLWVLGPPQLPPLLSGGAPHPPSPAAPPPTAALGFSSAPPPPAPPRYQLSRNLSANTAKCLPPHSLCHHLRVPAGCALSHGLYCHISGCYAESWKLSWPKHPPKKLVLTITQAGFRIKKNIAIDFPGQLLNSSWNAGNTNFQQLVNAIPAYTQHFSGEFLLSHIIHPEAAT